MFYRRHFSRPIVTTVALVDAAGALFLLIPVAVFVIVVSWDYVTTSWQIREASREAGGLIYPFLPILKSLIPIMFIMLLLQGIVLLLRSIRQLRVSA